MAFGRKKPQSRAEPTFVFVGKRKRDVKNSDDKQEDIPFTIPAFLRTGPLSARMGKTPNVDFKTAPKGERKAKTFVKQTPTFHSSATEFQKSQKTKKSKSSVQAKPAGISWFDNDFERIAETAKPKYMDEGSSEPFDPHYAFRCKDTAPRGMITPESENNDEALDGIFIFEEPDNEIESEHLNDKDTFEYPDDDHRTDLADWQQSPYFSDRKFDISSGNEFYVSDHVGSVKHHSLFSVGSKLPLITAVGLGLYAMIYFWPEKTPDKIMSVAATHETPAAQPDVDARIIVPAAPGKWPEVTPKVPIPKNRPATNAAVSDGKLAKQVVSGTVTQPRHVVLAPGPRPLSPYSSSSSGGPGVSGDNSSSEREETLLSELAVDVQKNLAVLGYVGVPQTGRLDAATRSAIRAFQANSGLTPTGEVDSRTLRLMNSMSRIQ